MINAAATTSNDVIDLHAGATSTIAGHAMTLSADSTVKTAYAGDGHVTLIANDLGNTRWSAGTASPPSSAARPATSS